VGLSHKYSVQEVNQNGNVGLTAEQFFEGVINERADSDGHGWFPDCDRYRVKGGLFFLPTCKYN
jgi:hypothetical protein